MRPSREHLIHRYDIYVPILYARRCLLRGGGGDTFFFHFRGPYNDDTSDEARLPGVNGEPPMRVEGPSVLVTFSASYWTGVAPAEKDYGWRLVCFTANDSDDAKALVAEAERAADRAEAVDAVNINGYELTIGNVGAFRTNAAPTFDEHAPKRAVYMRLGVTVTTHALKVRCGEHKSAPPPGSTLHVRTRVYV